jgi:dienelactone hydrolase
LRHVHISADGAIIRGDLVVPDGSSAVVLFAHGSGSGRLSSRNRYVARELNARGLATLLIDLLTEKEEEAERFSGHLRFDVGLLVDRLSAATRWLEQDSETSMLPIGYFGASTGAAAALGSAVHFASRVVAVVSRGGRPDLAGDALPQVQAPTLFLIGSRDEMVIELNLQASNQMNCERETVIIPGASHLFEEPGALEDVARLAGDWFLRHVGTPAQKTRRFLA